MKTTQDKNRKKSAGRPTVMTPETVGKLEAAFGLDSSVKEACSYAEIHPDTFYEYLKKNPRFSDKIEALRQKPILKARQTMVKNLDDPNHAKWYLERKVKNEFSPKTETDITTKGESINTSFVIPPEAIAIIEADLKKKKIDEL